MDFHDLPGIRKYAQKFDVLARLKPTTTLIVLAIFGFGLRVFFLQYRFAVTFDEVNYLKLGVSGHLNGFGDALHTYWSPLIPWLISLFCIPFSDYELAARLVSVVAGTALIWPVYGITKNVFGEKTGLVAAAFVMLFPPIAFQGTLILTEPVTMLFGSLAVLFGLSMLRTYSIAAAFMTGLCSALAYLAHPTGIGFLVILLFWLAFSFIFGLFRITKLRSVYLTSVLMLGFVIFALPYLLFLKGETGTWTISAKGKANLQMATPQDGDTSSFRALDASNTVVPIDLVFHQGTFLQYSKENTNTDRAIKPGSFAIKFIKNYGNMLQRSIPQTMTTLPLILLGIGLFGRMWQGRQGRDTLYLAGFIVFFWLILIPVFHINLRYLTTVWPLCTVFVAHGILIIYEWLRHYMPITKLSGRISMPASTLAVLAIVFMILALSWLPEFGRVISRDQNSAEYVADPVEQKLAGEWLRQHSSKTPVIMSRNHAVDFYAGNYDITESVTVPTNSAERILTYAKHRSVDYIVLNERYLQDYPALAFLITDRPEAPEGMRMVYNEKDSSGLRTVIYEML